MGKKTFDHLGNEYESRKKMCDAYGISVDCFSHRLARGWTLEEALIGYRKTVSVTVPGESVCEDATILCKQYGVPRHLFLLRLKKGWTVEEALQGKRKREDATDHLGNLFASKSEMCRHYGIKVPTYDARLQRGLSKEEALTSGWYARKASPNGYVSDHLGNRYETLKEMCDTYGITFNNFYARTKAGDSLKEALTKPKGARNLVVDHKGNRYASISEMCSKYGIGTRLYRTRIEEGMSIEEALTAPKKKRGKRPKIKSE